MCLTIQMVHLSRKNAKSTKFWAWRAKLKASAGRMLCMPDIDITMYIVLYFTVKLGYNELGYNEQTSRSCPRTGGSYAMKHPV